MADHERSLLLNHLADSILAAAQRQIDRRENEADGLYKATPDARLTLAKSIVDEMIERATG